MVFDERIKYKDDVDKQAIPIQVPDNKTMQILQQQDQPEDSLAQWVDNWTALSSTSATTPASTPTATTTAKTATTATTETTGPDTDVPNLGGESQLSEGQSEDQLYEDQQSENQDGMTDISTSAEAADTPTPEAD